LLLLMHVLFSKALLKPSASATEDLMWHIRSVYINSMDVIENVRVRTRHKPLLRANRTLEGGTTRSPFSHAQHQPGESTRS
jgi:hypothetical protein